MDSPASSPRATPWSTRLTFVSIWVLLHGALLLALAISSFLWPFAALILLPASYALVLGWYRPSAGAWGCNVVVGGFVWMVVSGMVHADGVLAFAVFGLLTGGTTVVLLPWRGRRTASWLLINLLGASAAGWIFPSFGGWGPSGSAIIGCFMAGALYGLITGPALAILLLDDQPAARTGGIDVR